MVAEKDYPAFYEVRDGEYVLGVWCVVSESRDWLCIVCIRDGQWYIQYRFRYYVDDKVRDSRDEKSAYGYVVHDTTESEMKETASALAVALFEKGFGDSKGR